MDQRVSQYISQQPSPQRQICQKLREIILAAIPNIQEEMKWGVPAYNDGQYYLVALKDHVNLGFTNRGLTVEELALFDGGGKTTRHLQISSIKQINEEKINQLLKLVAQSSSK